MDNRIEREKHSRIQLIDGARGLAILAMIGHHLLLDLQQYYGIYTPILSSRAFPWIQLFFVAIFVMVSGVSSKFSRSNLRRGIKTLLGGACVTGVSLWLMPYAPIWFGILQFMGCSMLLYALLEKLVDRIPADLALWLFTVLFAVYYYFYHTVSYEGTGHWFTLLGFPPRGYVASDYYPLLPFFFLFLAGTALGRLIREGRCPQLFYRKKVPFLAAVGRHTLWIYLLHQPLILGVCWIFLGSPF